jgi:glycosyltransferase involved in cell wall biosynthesis
VTRQERVSANGAARRDLPRWGLATGPSGHATPPLRIAQVAPLSVRVPPLRYGGTERVIHALTEELVRRGHEVTLFAAGTSLTSARLVAGSPVPLWPDGIFDGRGHESAQVEDVVERSGQFDIIHSHTDYFAPQARNRAQAPIVSTRHGRLDTPDVRAMMAAHRSRLISISNAQRTPLADLELDWVATVYNGLFLRQTYRLGAGDGGYLVFLGRIAAEKDPVTAIRVAIRAGIPIKIAARVAPTDEAYHRDKVVPLLGHPLVEWLGELDDAKKSRLLARAIALLAPIDWPEPFGLTFIEALAAGTPVIARPRGSLPEIIKRGVHGFLCETEEELVEACRLTPGLDRVICRAWALEHFSAERMARDYERAYYQILAGREAPASKPRLLAPSALNRSGMPVANRVAAALSLDPMLPTGRAGEG